MRPHPNNLYAFAPPIAFLLAAKGVLIRDFGDRLLGLVTTQYLSIMTSSAFHVNWTRPYNLRKYFRVHDCADRLHGGRYRRGLAVRAARSSAKVVPAVDAWGYFTNDTFAKDLEQNIDVMTNGRHWSDVVHATSSSNRARFLRLEALSRQQLFKLGVDALLSPRRNVIDATRAILEQLTASKDNDSLFSKKAWYVGVQIRCGSHGMLAWNDPKRHSLADIPCFVKGTMQACAGRTTCPIFLTADSVTASKAFRDAVITSGVVNAKIVEAEGPILHTDRTNVSAANAMGAPDPWLRSVVDWWMLKQASALVISRSGFGETAAWASKKNTPTQRLELGRPGACNLSVFDTLSRF